MELRTSDEIPELSICGTPLRLTTTLRPPPCTTDCSTSVSCSLGSPMVSRPCTFKGCTPLASRTEISMGRRSVIGRSLSWNVHASLLEEICAQRFPRILRCFPQGNNPREKTRLPCVELVSGASTALYDDSPTRQVEPS